MKKTLYFALVFFSLSFVFSPSRVLAGSEHNLAGYAWSSNIGWISFNCTNDASCGTVDYGVNEDNSGNLSGYAWSSNIGWIQFGSLSSFPSGNGTQAQNANITGNNLMGWAKALAADGNGWDGWISLSGTGYGATLSGQGFSGYAWGGDVVGWINFDAGVGNGVALTAPLPGFTLTGPSSLQVSSLNNNGTDSNIANIFVDNGGTSYNKTVTITATTSTNLPAGTTILYSFDSGATYSANPSVQISNYASGVGFRVRLNNTLPASPAYSVVLTGVGTDNVTTTKSVLLNQLQYNPHFQEL